MSLYTVPRAQQKVALAVIIITYYSAPHGWLGKGGGTEMEKGRRTGGFG